MSDLIALAIGVRPGAWTFHPAGLDHPRPGVAGYMQGFHAQLTDFAEIRSAQIQLVNNTGDLLEYTFETQSLIGKYDAHCYD